MTIEGKSTYNCTKTFWGSLDQTSETFISVLSVLFICSHDQSRDTACNVQIDWIPEQDVDF